MTILSIQRKNLICLFIHICLIEILVNKRNAIHYENMSVALAKSLSNAGEGWIYEMSFGNGGTSVDPTGIITYIGTQYYCSTST